MIIILNSLLSRLLISTSSSSGVLSYSSVWNIFLCHLILPIQFYFYAFCRLVMFPDIREVVLCRKHTMGSEVHSCLVTRPIWFRDALSVDCLGPSIVAGWLLQVCWEVWLAPSGWLPGPALCRGCQPLVGGLGPGTAGCKVRAVLVLVHRLAGLGHETGFGANVGLLIGGAMTQGIPGWCWSTSWWVRSYSWLWGCCGLGAV